MSGRDTEPRVVVETRAELREFAGGDSWEVEVRIDGEWVGAGWTPGYPFDLVNDILYGDKQDWMNDSAGALGDHLARLRASSPSGEVR